VVPCTLDGLRKNGKPMAIKFTILRPVSEGFAGAPYKMKEQKRDPDSKPLSQLRFVRNEAGQSQPVMAMWSFHRSGMYDKGPRGELNWTLRAGNTLNLWLDEVSPSDLSLVLPPIFQTDLNSRALARRSGSSRRPRATRFCPRASSRFRRSACARSASRPRTTRRRRGGRPSKLLLSGLPLSACTR
jgi:hypothetical protein